MADITMTQTQMEAIPISSGQVASNGLVIRKFIDPDWFRLTYGSTPDGAGNWPLTIDRIVLLNFVKLPSVFFKGTCVNGVQIDLATFPIPTNILGETYIRVRHLDLGTPANNGIGHFIIPWWRFGGGPVIGTPVVVAALQVPGTLSGITLPALAVVGNTIVSRYTGKAGLSIDVVVEFTPTIYKF